MVETGVEETVDTIETGDTDMVDIGWVSTDDDDVVIGGDVATSDDGGVCCTSGDNDEVEALDRIDESAVADSDRCDMSAGSLTSVVSVMSDVSESVPRDSVESRTGRKKDAELDAEETLGTLWSGLLQASQLLEDILKYRATHILEVCVRVQT